jgi:adenosyl cobinamide kinase/adenosyl cobinamide phosphate guanylyltransferase
MQHRIARHREERGDAFTTLEEPTDLVAVLRTEISFDVALMDPGVMA